MIRNTLICGFVFAALNTSTAWAGEKSGHIFGGPVIFESSLSYGWMADSSNHGLIQSNADSLIVNNAQGGAFTATHSLPGTNPAVPFTTPLNYNAPRVEASIDNAQLFKGGFSHSQELNFGIRTKIADDLETFIRFEHARLKSNGGKQQTFNVVAIANTSYGRSNRIVTINGLQFIEPGLIFQTFTGSGKASIGLADMDMFNVNFGMKKNLFQAFHFANTETKLFIDFAIGLSTTDTIAVESTGLLPDITNIVTVDFNRRHFPLSQPGFTLQLPNRAITSTASLSQSTEVVSAAVRPTIILGMGLDFSLYEHTSLSVDVRYKFLKIPSNVRDNSIDLSRLTLGLRLSQSF